MGNIEWALTGFSGDSSCNVVEQCAIWRQKLQEYIKNEQSDIAWLQHSSESMAFFMDTIIRHEDWRHSITHHARMLDFVFSTMHHIAYFDGLLGETGFSKGNISEGSFTGMCY